MNIPGSKRMSREIDGKRERDRSLQQISKSALPGREADASCGVWFGLSPLQGTLILAVLLLPVLFVGCITKAKADAQARAAFVAGEQQAMRNMEQVKARGPSVTVIGEVKNQRIPWTSELTLAKAVVAAEYVGTKDPSEILIVRQGKALRYDPKKLLDGVDVPLEPQDLIQLNP
jgi:hypothetical protein